MSDEVLIPTPDQIEQGMVQKELASQKKEDNPLDAHAQLFYLYTPRFQSQLQFMSSKQLVLLAQTLAGSEHNKLEDVSFIANVSKGINKKGLLRTISAVIEHPLSNDKIKLMDKKEQKLFHLFDDLLTNKYMTCIKDGMEKLSTDSESVKQVEDVILHTTDTQSPGFTKRAQVEKDAFATGNKLLASKFLMMLCTYLEDAKNIEEKAIFNEEKAVESIEVNELNKENANG